MIKRAIVFDLFGRIHPLGQEIGGQGEPFDLVHLAEHEGNPEGARACQTRRNTGPCYEATRRRFKIIVRPFRCAGCHHILSSEQSYMNHLFAAHKIPLGALAGLLDGQYEWRTVKEYLACSCAPCLRLHARLGIVPTGKTKKRAQQST